MTLKESAKSDTGDLSSQLEEKQRLLLEAEESLAQEKVTVSLLREQLEQVKVIDKEPIRAAPEGDWKFSFWLFIFHLVCFVFFCYYLSGTLVRALSFTYFERTAPFPLNRPRWRQLS
jgi:hypothetical protein